MILFAEYKFQRDCYNKERENGGEDMDNVFNRCYIGVKRIKRPRGKPFE